MTKASTLHTKLLYKRVSIRRSGKIVRGVLTQSLVAEIKDGRLKKDDEISADEKNWVRLDHHYQLSKYFPLEPSPILSNPPADMSQQLTELSELLKDLNK